MTAKKRVTSIICIISLILAITAGILLSVGAQPVNNYYGGESVQIYNTDATIDAQTSIKPGNIPEGAVAIPDAATLQAFIRGDEGYDGNYGYLTADIDDFDWPGVGARQILAKGRTLDGNGKSLTLTEKDAGTLAGYDTSNSNFEDPLGKFADDNVSDDIISHVTKRNYGLLVDYNLGIIKNFNFIYNTTDCKTIQNYGDGDSGKAMYSQHVGIVCGTNTGEISNCDLEVSGKFTFYYNRGKISDVDTRKNRFETAWGALAGRNSGIVTNITAKYGEFTLDLNTVASNSEQGGFLSKKGTSAKTMAGGLVGRNVGGTSAQVTNIIIRSNPNTTIRPLLNSTAVNVGSNEGDNKAIRAGEFAAVVCGNSVQSHTVGESETEQGKVDNIIVDVNVNYTKSVSKQTMGEDNQISRNGVVYCGRSTNVTILRVSGDVDLRTDNCRCAPGATYQHNEGYGNLIHTDEFTNVTVGFDEDNNQVITVTPKDPTSTNTMLGEIQFTKYDGKGIVQANANGIPNNGSTYIYNNEEERFTQSTFTVSPYQDDSSKKYWEIYAYSYEIATVANVGASEYTYTGEDFLNNQFRFTTVTNSKSGTVNPACFNARTSEDVAVTSGRLPGEYVFSLKEKEAGLAYADTVTRVVA